MTNLQTKTVFIWLLFIASAAICILALPREGRFKYQFQKGSPWMYDNLDASFDFPILKTDEEIRLERDSITRDFTPYYNIKTDIEAEQLRTLSLENSFSSLAEEPRAEIIRLIQFIYREGIMSEPRFKELNPALNLVVVRGKEAEKTPPAKVFTPTSAYDYFMSQLANLPKEELILIQTAKIDFAEYFVPNLVFDQATTLALQSESVQDVSLTKGIIYAGQRIINKGDVVTGDSEQVLNSLRAEYQSKIGFSGNLSLLILGQALLIGVCLLLMIILIAAMRPQMLQSRPELTFVLCLFSLIVVGSSLVYKFNSSALYFIPFPVFVLFLDSFFPSKISLPLYIAMLLPLTIVTQGYQLVISNIIAGGVAVFAFRVWGRGWQQFLSALLVYLTYAIVAIAFHLLSEGSFNGLNGFVLRNYAFASILIVACYPLVFLFEKLFGFVSISRLRDLADTGNKALRELSEKAPGTMQHVMQVANLAETAARGIDAYALLCRVGALYHDLGKINNPQYFIENQNASFNPHTLLSAQESARIVIQHVEDGKLLAKKYGLPSLVSDFIESHHGQTRTEYFYTIYCNQGGDPDNVEDFTYRGKLPTSKEQVIVMMADAVEAACRSLPDYTPESISQMVEKMVKTRISEDQLKNASITYKDIQRIQEIFKNRIQDIYHTRLTYPTRRQESV